MAAPDTLCSQAELEHAITAEKLRQLLPGAGKKEADADRVLLALRSGTGAILSPISKAIAPVGIDTWWEASTTTERDKAEIKRLAISASIYYAEFYGLKGGEEMPQALSEEMARAEKRAEEIGNLHSRFGAKEDPASAGQHELLYSSGCGRHPEGSPRDRWRGF